MQLSLTQLPWYGQIGAFVVVSGLSVFGFWNFYVSDFQQELDGKQTQLAVLRGDINKGLATARRLQEFETEVAELQGRLDSLRAVLPDEKDYADLLRRIQTLATQSNLTVQTFTPQAPVTKQIHAEWPIRLQLEGTYHNLAMFYDRLSKFPRLFNVGEIHIRAKTPPEPNATVTAECTAMTFVLLENPVPAAPGAAPVRR